MVNASHLNPLPPVMVKFWEWHLALGHRSVSVGYYHYCWWCCFPTAFERLSARCSLQLCSPSVPWCLLTPSGSEVQLVTEALVNHTAPAPHHILTGRPVRPPQRSLSIDGHLAGSGLLVAVGRVVACHSCFSLRCADGSHSLSPVPLDGGQALHGAGDRGYKTPCVPNATWS